MMKILNYWEQKKVSQELLAYMQEQFKTLPHFQILKNDDDILKDMEQIRSFKKYQDIIIFGIGGSSLGGQMLYQFSNNKDITLHFIDNIDPQTFQDKISCLDCSKTGVISISKSGNTAETLIQTFLAKQVFEESLGNSWSDHFAVLTENKKSALRLFAEKYDLKCLDHDQNIGGRFCVFTNVGAIIAALCDIDFIAFRNGARDVLKESLDVLLQGSQHIVDLYHTKNVNQSIMMVYADSFEMYAQWYGQLWAESLGKIKNGQHIGITPVSSVGAVDQHSQLQLYLDGPRDKIISFVTIKNHAKTSVVKNTGIEHDALKILENKTMGDLFIAEQKGTLDALVNRGCFVREFELKENSVYDLGQIVLYQMIETIATAFLLGIDPFDQPAVEESKVRAMAYLKG